MYVKKELIILLVSFCLQRLQTETLLKVEGETYTRFVNVTYEHEYWKKMENKNTPFSVKTKKCVQGLQPRPRSLLALESGREVPEDEVSELHIRYRSPTMEPLLRSFSFILA